MFIENDYPHKKVRPRRGRILVWLFVCSYKYCTPTEWGLLYCSFINYILYVRSSENWHKGEKGRSNEIKMGLLRPL